MSPKVIVADDGLVASEIGSWADRKHRLIHKYADMFSTGMKNNWDCRVYIDLFSGAGKAKIKGSSRFVDCSPLLALNVKTPFDRYIFSELEPDFIAALEERVRRQYPSADAKFVQGDVNDQIERVIGYIPKPSREYRVLSFCLVDPYKLAAIKFSTIERLSKYFMDFLVLVACNMDAHRNTHNYVAAGNQTVECYLNNPCWRDEWEEAKSQRGCAYFSDFIVEAFSNSMAKLNYRPVRLEDTVMIRLPKNQSPLYRLAFFSRNPAGSKFWAEARKYSNPQRKLF